MSFSPSNVILEGIRLATEADIRGLQDLTSAFPEILKLELTLRILLSYLPESVEPSLYTGFLRNVVSQNLHGKRNDGQQTLDTESTEEEANRQLRSLRLRTLRDSSSDFDSSFDPLSLFLISRARQIDAETGNLSLVKELIEPFLEHSRDVRIWAISTLLPLLRLNYECFTPHDVSHTLESFEGLQEEKAVNALLSANDSPSQEQKEQAQLGKDLRSLVGPWILGEPLRKRRKVVNKSGGSGEELEQPLGTESFSSPGPQPSDWAIVNNWLQEISMTNLARATQAIEEWRGPQDVDYGSWATDDLEAENATTSSTTAYLEMVMSIVYSSPYTSADCYAQLNQLLARLALLAKVKSPFLSTNPDSFPAIESVDSNFLSMLSPTDLELQNLRNGSNPLTTPSTAALELAQALVWSGQKLEALGHPLKIGRIAQLCLFDSSESQQKEFQKFVRLLRTHGVKDDPRWIQIRQGLLQLRSWTAPPLKTQDSRDALLGLFSRVSIDAFETELLQAYLSNSRRFYTVFVFRVHSLTMMSSRIQTCDRDLLRCRRPANTTYTCPQYRCRLLILIV